MTKKNRASKMTVRHELVDGTAKPQTVEEAVFRSFDRFGNCMEIKDKYPAGYDQPLDMLKTGKIIYSIASNSKTQFTKKLEPSEYANEILTGLGASSGKPCKVCERGPTNKIIIRRILMVSKQDCDWKIMFWGNKKFMNVDLDMDSFSGAVYLHNGICANKLIHYDSGPLSLPYEDLDGEISVHLTLVNDSGEMIKKSRKYGSVAIRMFYEPTG